VQGEGIEIDCERRVSAQWRVIQAVAVVAPAER